MKLIHFTSDNQLKRNRLSNSFWRTKSVISLFLVCIISNTQAATSVQAIEEIRQTAKIFLEEKQSSADNPNIEITLGNIDPRMKLVKCDGELQAFFPQSARTKGKTTVGVKCIGTVAWKLFISANIQEFQDVWVSTRNLSTNEIISANDIKLTRMLVSGMRKAPIEDLKQILNTSPRRSIRSGSIIFNDSVCLVCRGEKVSVIAQNNYMSIRVDGIALSNASLGETTQIRNSKSKRIFGAKVTGKSQLSVHISSTY